MSTRGIGGVCWFYTTLGMRPCLSPSSLQLSPAFVVRASAQPVCSARAAPFRVVSAALIFRNAGKVTATKMMPVLFSMLCIPDVNNGTVQLRNAILSSTHVVLQWKLSRAYDSEAAAVRGYKPRS